MSYGLWLSAGGMQVNEYRQSLAANNMANVETAGFKRDLAVIHERDVESVADPLQTPFSDRMLDTLTGGVWVRPTYTSFEQGRLDNTGRNLDTALHGNGFFAVTDGDNELYTRDGRFVINPTGELVMVAGEGKYQVLNANGQPIEVADPTAGPIQIDRDGSLFQNGAEIAALRVVDFADYQNLTKTGDNLIANVGDDEPVPANATVMGGFVEASTVDPISAMTNMIEVSRAYGLNAQMVSLQDETIGQAVSRVGRIG